MTSKGILPSGNRTAELDSIYPVSYTHLDVYKRQALECLETTTVDLIISDIVMPHMDGFELLKSIRSDNMLCHIPFILLSALDSIDSKIAGLDYGADAYIDVYKRQIRYRPPGPMGSWY